MKELWQQFCIGFWRSFDSKWTWAGGVLVFLIVLAIKP